MDADHGIPHDRAARKDGRDGRDGVDHALGDGADIAGWSSTPWPSGWSVVHVRETGSTNHDLIAAAERGEVDDRTVFVTDHQTAGRGRLDRRWDAPPGANLLVSILFAGEPDPSFPFMALVSLAVIEAVEAAVGSPLDSRLGLKWPNDVLLDGRKLAGVLAQRSAITGGTVVGAGINVSWAPSGAASIVGDLGLQLRPSELLCSMLLAVDDMVVRADSATHVAGRYGSRLLTLGQVVRIELPGDRSVSGTAVDVDADGRLLVDVDGDIDIFDVGDVVHLRPA